MVTPTPIALPSDVPGPTETIAAVKGATRPRRRSPRRFVTVWLVGLTVISLGAIAAALWDAAPSSQPTGPDVAGCVERYAGGNGGADFARLNSAIELCYQIISTNLLSEQQIVRNENFRIQLYENVVLLWMVVAITLSGVLLAGLQLLGSYRLALVGRGAFAGEATELAYKPDNVAVRSSVIGVIILAISFAFFMVFVLYVYTLKDVGSASAAPPAAAAAMAPPVVGTLVPYAEAPTVANRSTQPPAPATAGPKDR